MTIIKNNYILILILILSFFTKFLFLNQFPNGITNDELHFVLNSKSVYLNFSNLANNWNPLSLRTIPNESSSELPFLLMSPIVGPLPANLFNARLFHTIIGTISIFLLYLICYKLFNRKVALCTAFIATLNPWYFYVYRTAFDAPIAIFFILLYFVSLLYLKSFRIIFSLIPILIAFYSYIGIKPIILPISIISTVFIYFFYNKKNLKYLIIINFIVLFVTILFLSNKSPRTSELVFPNSPTIATIVDTRRAQTSPNSLTPLFTNKYTVYFEFVTNKWLNSFSPNLLFIKGDDTSTGSLQRHGYFFYIDFVFIIFGFYLLYKTKKKVFFFLSALLIIAPLPESIRKDTIPAYVFHSSLQFPILVIISSLGFYQIFTKFRFIFIIYLFSFINLLFIYFYQYPTYASQAFSFNNQLITQFLLSSPHPNQKIYVICREPDTLFKNYLFYSNSLSNNTFNQISQIYQNRHLNFFDYQNIIFSTPDNGLRINQNDIVIVEEGVPYSPKNGSNKMVLKNKNALVIFNIFNSTVCQENSNKLCGQYINSAF